MADNKKKGIYLYCITADCPSLTDLDCRYVMGSVPFAIRYKRLHVVASEIILENFAGHITKHELDLEWLERESRAHNNLLLALMEDMEILPISFGTVVADRNAAQRLLGKNYHLFKEVIHRLSGFREWNLQVTIDEEKLDVQIEKEYDEARKLRKKIDSSTAAMAHMFKKQLDFLRKKHRQGLIDKIGERLQECLHSLPEEEKMSERRGLTAGSRGKREQVVVERLYLVAEERREEFIASLEMLDGEIGEAFQVQLIGPWPVYNFVPETAAVGEEVGQEGSSGEKREQG